MPAHHFFLLLARRIIGVCVAGSYLLSCVPPCWEFPPRRNGADTAAAWAEVTGLPVAPQATPADMLEAATMAATQEVATVAALVTAITGVAYTLTLPLIAAPTMEEVLG